MWVWVRWGVDGVGVGVGSTIYMEIEKAIEKERGVERERAQRGQETAVVYGSQNAQSSSQPQHIHHTATAHSHVHITFTARPQHGNTVTARSQHGHTVTTRPQHGHEVTARVKHRHEADTLSTHESSPSAAVSIGPNAVPVIASTWVSERVIECASE